MSRAVSGAGWNSVSSVTVSILQIIQYVILARLLSPDDFGIMAMLLIVIGFAQIYADLGISEAVIHKLETSSRQLSALYWINLAVATALTLLIVLVAEWISVFFKSPSLAGYLWLIALSIVIAALGRQFQVLLQRELAFKQLAFIEIAAQAAGLITAILLALVYRNVFALVGAYITVVSLRSAILLSVSWRKWRPGFHLEFRGLGEYIRFGGWQLGDQTVNFLSRRLDQVVIGAVLGAQALGYYNLAFQLVILPISRINPILTQVAFPVFARIQQDRKRMKDGYIKVLQTLALVNFPLLLGLAAVAGMLVPIAFGDQWLPAVPVLQLLALVSLFRSVGNPVGALLMATGKVWMGFYWNVMIAVTQIPVVYVAAREGGILGVAVSLAVLQLIYLVPFFKLILQPLIDIRAKEYVMSVLPALVISLSMGSAVYAVDYWFLDVSAINLVTCVLLGVLLYAILGVSFMGAQFRGLRELMER